MPGSVRFSSVTREGFVEHAPMDFLGGRDRVTYGLAGWFNGLAGLAVFFCKSNSLPRQGGKPGRGRGGVRSFPSVSRPEGVIGANEGLQQFSQSAPRSDDLAT